MHPTRAPHGQLGAPDGADGNRTPRLAVHPDRPMGVRPAFGQALVEDICRFGIAAEPQLMHGMIFRDNDLGLHAPLRQPLKLDRRAGGGRQGDKKGGSGTVKAEKWQNEAVYC